MKLRTLFQLSAGIFMACLPINLLGFTEKTKPTTIAVRVDKPVSLTGNLSDPGWQMATPIELGYEIRPGENTPAALKTEVRVLYDRQNLYISFQCYDSAPGKIRAHLCDRDQIFQDDYVIVTMDPANNYQRGYEFAVNPMGIQGDLLMSGNMEDLSYDMVWSSAASMDEKGWTAELMIPFKVLSFSAEEIQNWTITFLRCMPRNNRYMFSWTPVDRSIPSFLAQGGILEGLTGIKSGHSFDLLPYLMAQQSGTRVDPESPMDNSPIKARVGGGIKYAPGPGLSLDLVINPDFSQIESDAGQISVNTTFALYYPEKRPFFMTGSDLLQTPMYYSRTINNPLVASKITGKAGKVSYIALAALDRNTGITVPGEEQSNTVQTELSSYAGVGRVRYDIGNENFIGGLMLSRNFDQGHNYLGGLDWNFKFWKNWYWQGELFLTHTAEINDSTLFQNTREFGNTGYDATFNGEQYFGHGMHLALIRQGRNYSLSLVQNNFSPTYQTYNGMFPSIGTRQSYMRHGYSIHPNGKILKSASVYLPAQLEFNYEGLFKEFVLQPGVSLNLIGQTRVQASYMAINMERFRGTLFEGVRRWVVMANSVPVRGVTLGLNGQVGRFIYRASTPALGKGYNLTASVDLEPASRLKSGFTVSFARLDPLEGDGEFYKGFIIRNMTSYQFTRRLFLRAIFEYNSFSNSFNVYPLLSYKFNAFTMFCAGMTQDIMRYDHPEDLYLPVSHQYFVKLQYLFSK